MEGSEKSVDDEPMRLSLLLAMVSAIMSLAFPLTTFAEEEAPVLLRSFARPPAPVPPFPEGRFEPRRGETIAWLGGTEVFNLDRYGILEAGFYQAWPELALRWRNLAWQGDTVYHQVRPRYYYTERGDTQPGSIPDHRERTEAGIIVLSFGKMESLEGRERLPDFVAAYGKILDDLAMLTPRLVLIEPIPFIASGPAAALAEQRNLVLADYRAAIAKLAEERGLRLIRLDSAVWETSLSDNGVHLNEKGHQVFAAELLKALVDQKPEGERNHALDEAIARKNHLWQQYYRPSNWAFLFGDRQHVPASRDAERREERWFVREIDVLPRLIAESEEEIQRYAQEAIPAKEVTPP